MLGVISQLVSCPLCELFGQESWCGSTTGNVICAAHFRLPQQSCVYLVILGTEISLYASTLTLYADKLVAVTCPTYANEAYRTTKTLAGRKKVACEINYGIFQLLLSIKTINQAGSKQ